MSLYELAREIREVESYLDVLELEHPEEVANGNAEIAVVKALEAIKTDAALEIAGLVKWRENLLAEAEALDAEIALLRAKRDAKKKRAEGVKAFIAQFLKATNQTKVNAGIRSLFFRKGATSVLVDESQVESWTPAFFDEAVERKAIIARYDVKVSELKKMPGYLDQPGVIEQTGEDSLVIR